MDIWAFFSVWGKGSCVFFFVDYRGSSKLAWLDGVHGSINGFDIFGWILVTIWLHIGGCHFSSNYKSAISNKKDYSCKMQLVGYSVLPLLLFTVEADSGIQWNFRTCKQLDSAEDKGETMTGRSKCIPRSIKASLSRHPRSESMRSPISDKPRNSSDGVDSSQTVSPSVSFGSSRRITEPSLGKRQSKRLDSFREDEDVIQIEERYVSIPHLRNRCSNISIHCHFSC